MDGEAVFHSSGYHAWSLSVPDGGTNLSFERLGIPTDSALIWYGLWTWKRDQMEETLFTTWGGTVWTAYRAFLQSDDFNGGDPLMNARTNVACFEERLPVLGGCGSVHHVKEIELATGGDWNLLVLMGADGPFDGSFEFSFKRGGSILNHTKGPAFLDREEQFRGNMTILTEGRYPDFAKFQDNVTVRHTVENRFFGFFQGFTDTDILRMSFDGPLGSDRGKRGYEFNDAPPGTYTFRVDYDIETKPSSYNFVLGADVTLPWEP